MDATVKSQHQITTQLFVNMVIKEWTTQNDRFSELVDGLTDEQIAKDISAGRNSGTYLLGHLTAVHDAMLPLLGFGDKLYPSLYQTFVKSPDKSGQSIPAISELRNQWKQVTKVLSDHIGNANPEEWFTRHTSVSEEDFAKEPHRNKLNVLINRTNHLSNHRGQMVLLKKKD